MSKKILSLFMSVVLTLVFVIPASAAESQPSLTKAEIQKAFQEIGEKYGLELINTESTSFKDQERMKFDSTEELEAFIKNLVEADRASNGGTIVIPKESKINPALKMTDGHANWFAALLFGAFSWKNIWYHYDVAFDSKGYGYLSKISNETSGLTGIQLGLSWTQTGANSSCSGNKAFLKVNGYYLVGAEVYGVPVGYKQNSTWTQTVVHDNLPNQI